MPPMIDLSQKSIVIVGGGKVATKRASTLIEYCADVHIVSPTISTTLKELLDNEISLGVKKNLSHKMLNMPTL